MGYLQTANNSGPVAGITTSVALIGVTAGSTIVIAVSMKSENRVIDTLVSSLSGTITQQAREANADNGEALEVWILPNASAGDHTFTITFDTSAQTASWAMALEYGSVDAASFDVDDSSQASNATSVAVGPTATTAQADETVIAIGRSTSASRPFTDPAGFTNRVSLDTTRFVAWDKTVSATGTQSVTLDVTGGNSNFEAWVGTLKNSGGGGEPPPPSPVIVGKRFKGLIYA